MASLQTFKSIHDKEMLLVNNYEYMFDKKRLRIRDQNNIYYWKCTKRCGATFRTIFEHGEHKQDKCFINNDHSHAPDTVKHHCKILKNKIKKCAQNSQDSPNQIYQNEIANCNVIISSQVTKNASKQIVKRQRKGKELEPVSLNFIPSLELQNTISGQPFLLKNVIERNNKFMIFTTVKNCIYLRESNFWLADGTFKACPGIFKQIFTIHGSISRGINNNICVPLVYVLITNQTEDDYKTVLNEFNNFAIKNNINFESNKELEIITDFEKASINAINDVFPFVTHSACFFHFCQNIWRHIQKEGLSTKYMEDPEFNLICRHLPALSFLPVNKVRIKKNYITLTFF